MEEPAIDRTPRSWVALLPIALLVGVAFAGLTLEVAYGNSDGLSARQQEESWNNGMALVDAADRLETFHAQEGRWPVDVAEVEASSAAADGSALTDGLGGAIRYRVVAGEAVLAPDGLDRRPGGVGDAADTQVRVAPPVGAGGGHVVPRTVGTRWQFLRTNAPPRMLWGAAVCGLVVAVVVFCGSLLDFTRSGGRLPATRDGWAALLLFAGATTLGLAAAALAIGFVMALVHAWSGPGGH